MGGGAMTFLQDVAAGLAARGHTIDVFAASGSVMPGGNLVDLGIRSEDLAESLYRHDQPSRPTAASELAFRAVFQAIQGRGYEVVHNHAFDVPAVRLGAKLDVPVVHTLHLPPDDGMVTALRGARSGPHPPILGAVSKSHAEAWGQHLAVDVILFPKIPTATVPWSTDAGARAIFAGRLTPEKGPREAVDAALEAGLGIDVFGQPYDPDYVARELSTIPTSPEVVFHGGVARGVLLQAMSQAAVMICPSRWQEPLGLVAIESIATGTPVVAYAVGGLPEVIVDGITGFLVAPGDHDGLVAAIRRVPTLKRVACRQYAVEHLDIARAVDEHEALYRRLASRNDQSARGA